MKTLIKKLLICSLMAGVMQIGLNTTLSEASPREDWQQQHNDQHLQEIQRHSVELKQHANENVKDWNDRQVKENQRHDLYLQQDNERQYLNELEMQRHEVALQRYDNEEWQDWNDRQWIENQQHDLKVVEIEATVLQLFPNNK
jgi:hypothetical protein